MFVLVSNYLTKMAGFTLVFFFWVAKAVFF